MTKSLPHFAVLIAIAASRVATAQSAPAPVAAPPQPVASVPAVEASTPIPSGDGLLMRAENQIERRASISARMRYQINVGGQELYGIGSYWQQGSGEELKVRLELQLAGQDAKLLHVSNSRFLWIDRRLPTGRSVTRYDLRQLRSDPAIVPPDLDKLDAGKANWSSIQPLMTAHSGGLPSLLTALGDNFSFLPPQTMRLAIEPPISAEPTNVPVFAIVGQWKPEKLAALLAKNEAPPAADAAKKSKPGKIPTVPERMPQEVLVLVGQADLFPYRIEYRRLETPVAPAGEGPPIPYQLSVHPLVVLETSDVVFDAPIAAGQFDYTPGDANWADQTASLLDRLRKTREAQVATRARDQAPIQAR